MPRKAIDETGHVYGRWTVLYRVENKGHDAAWRCRCECGNEKDVTGKMLRLGISTSCGCYQKERAAETNRKRTIHKLNVGDRINHLVVLQVEDYKALCQCDCGKQTWIGKSSLTSKSPQKTCGCGIGQGRNHAFIDETGNRYGRLTVIEEAGKNQDGRVLWRCKCDCGNEKITLGKSLRQGLVLSCGCLHSLGEQKIYSLLTSLNINFETQKTFDDLRSAKNYPLYFDFYLPDYNILIEYQGEQHFHSSGTSGWNTEDKLKDLQYRDNLKREYCKKNNIPLVEICYTDFNKIDENYILSIMEANK